jgi:O-antigen/teichoic acid export membrane protein
MEITRRAANATWWSAIEIISRYGAQIVVMVVLARLLSPTDFGLFAMLLVFTSLAALLVDAGFSTALIQRQRTTDDDEATVFWFSLAVSIFVAAALWGAAPLIARFYDQAEVTSLLRFSLFALPIGALASVPDALLTQRLDFGARAKAEVMSSMCAGTAALGLAWRGFGVWSLAWQMLIALGVRCALLWIFAKWRPRGRFNAESLRRLFGFGGYMLMASALSTLSTGLQSLLIGKFFDASSLGYYTLAQNTQQAPASFVSSILNRVGLPVFSSVSGQPHKLAGALRLSLRVTIFAFVPCMVGIAIIAKPLIGSLYGERWVPAAPMLSILALSATLWPLHVLNLVAINAQGRSDLFFRLEVLKRVIAIALIIVAAKGGPVAIAWAVFASSLFAVVTNTWYSKRLLGYGALAQLRDQTGTFVLATIAGLSGWVIMHWTHPGIISTLGAIAIAGATYLGGAVIARHAALADIIGLWRTLRLRGEIIRIE